MSGFFPATGRSALVRRWGAAAVVAIVLATLPLPGVTASDGVAVVVNGTQLSEQGLLVEGSTLVPMRCIFEALGAWLEWDGATQTVTATKDTKKIRLTIGSKTAYINDFPLTMAVAPALINGKTYVPLRFVAESLGAEVGWDGAARRADIRLGPPPPPPDPYLTGYQPSITLADYQKAKEYAQQFKDCDTPEFDVPYERVLDEYGWYNVTQISTPWVRAVYKEWTALRDRETVSDAEVDEFINGANGALNFFFHIAEEGESKGEYKAVLIQGGGTLEPEESALESREEFYNYDTGSVSSREGTAQGYTYRWYEAITRFTFNAATIDPTGQVELKAMAPDGKVRSYYWDLRAVR